MSLQIVFIILGGSLGVLGIITGFVYIVNYLNTLDDYRTPYLAPYSPRIPQDLKDAIFTSPVGDLKQRPKTFSPTKKERL